MWQTLKRLFSDSETIFWARLQVAAGAVIEIVTAVDPYLFAPVLGKYFPLFLILNGLATEYLRRRRADDL